MIFKSVFFSLDKLIKGFKNVYDDFPPENHKKSVN